MSSCRKALLFLNGEAPIQPPNNISQYRYIACADGAYHRYVRHFDIHPHFIIGDLDSCDPYAILPKTIQVIHTPDQNHTDFEKAMLFLGNYGITEFDVYGATGRASDHFLGNLSIVLQYEKQYQFDFYDDYCHFFLAKSEQSITGVLGKTISLIPLSIVDKLSLIGFKYSLTNAQLGFGKQISIRNQAVLDTVSISFATGSLLVVIER